jgi:uncharacterized membrane protein
MADDANTPELFVVSYPSEGEAAEALKTLQQLGHEQVVHLKDAAYVVRHADGKLTVHETQDFKTGTSALAGAVAGGLIGYLTKGKALEGAALGGAAGFGAGKLVDLGFKDQFLTDIGEELQPGTSAIVAIVHFENVEKALATLQQYAGGKLLRHNLPADVADKVAGSLGS